MHPELLCPFHSCCWEWCFSLTTFVLCSWLEMFSQPYFLALPHLAWRAHTHLKCFYLLSKGSELPPLMSLIFFLIRAPITLNYTYLGEWCGHNRNWGFILEFLVFLTSYIKSEARDCQLLFILCLARLYIIWPLATFSTVTQTSLCWAYYTPAILACWAS